jgi:proline racemase
MRWAKTITVAKVHAEGEIGHVITGGVLPPPGATMFDKKLWLEREGDELRRFLLFEPRGQVSASVNLILPPTRPDCDAGFIVMESTDYPPMSGSNCICVVTTLLETGMLPMREPETVVTLDTPGGVVRVTAECREGRCKSVTLTNVPAYLAERDAVVEVPGVGTVTGDVAYGGAFFFIVDAAALGFAMVPGEARDLVVMGEKIKAAAAEQVPVVHVENPDINTVTFTLFAGPFAGPGKPSLNAVVVSPGRLDRSPCGTGTTARLAAMHARGLMKRGDVLPHDSLIGTRFVGRIVDELEVGGRKGISVTISGRAWVTGIANYGLDPDDPFPTGYKLNDTWFR